MEPELFKKVTGLDVKDFELLVSLNVFNEAMMNDAVYKFKRYEDASLSYTGVDRHAGERVGLYSTVVSREDYNLMAGQLITSMEAAAPRDDDIPEKPYFINTADDDDEEAAPAVKEPKQKAPARPAITTPIQTKAAPTYRPAFVPPAPIVPKKPEPIAVDVSDVVAGAKVTHKAFGAGTVTSIEKGLILISFGGMEKKFQFPGAFQQGFLRKG